MIDYQNQFLGKIKAIKPYLVEFKKDSSIKSKIYLKYFVVRGTNK